MPQFPADFEELVETFDYLDDWEERYRYLIDLGRALPPFPEHQRIPANKVDGCMSQVWMIFRVNHHPDLGISHFPPRIDIIADSDAQIVKGLIAILLILFSGKDTFEITSLDIAGCFARLRLEEHLSPNRRNGFFAMIDRIKSYAAHTMHMLR